MDDSSPLTSDALERILRTIPQLTIAVIGDLFLDRYLDLDASLTEPSLETGLDAYQVVDVRAYPGAAGTVINNLVALGVGRVCPIAVLGDDGEGFELRQALNALRVVEGTGLLISSQRRTPTYIKPLLHQPGLAPRELNRVDIKNRQAMPEALVEQILAGLWKAWPQIDGLVVLDQVSEADCGVITSRVRACIAELAGDEPRPFVLADSRERIGLFRNVSLKPNRQEAQRAASAGGPGTDDAVDAAVAELSHRAGRWVFCTEGDRGILLASAEQGVRARIAAYPVHGPIDSVGAGDSTSAAIVCAMASGAPAEEAAAFGNLVASITIQQLGTTGAATPTQIRQRWLEVS
jgi:bifunctional ADP-heptose synthase (sugar kinase/adenylyltransferase)